MGKKIISYLIIVSILISMCIPGYAFDTGEIDTINQEIVVENQIEKEDVSDEGLEDQDESNSDTIINQDEYYEETDETLDTSDEAYSDISDDQESESNTEEELDDSNENKDYTENIESSDDENKNSNSVVDDSLTDNPATDSNADEQIEEDVTIESEDNQLEEEVKQEEIEELTLIKELTQCETLDELGDIIYDVDISRLTDDEAYELLIFVEDTWYITGEDRLYEEITRFICLSFPHLFEDMINWAVDGVIYFDLYHGNVTINASKYTGYIYNSSTGTVETVTGTHSASNNYYVFQSKGEKTVGMIGGNIQLPSYSRVSHPTNSSKDWADYIINHPNKSTKGADSVDEVIVAWGEVKHGATAVSSGAANSAGRKPTKNYISVTGGVGVKANITVDNVWSSNWGSTAGEGHSSGITFMIPNSGSSNKNINNELSLYFIGDNRFGRIHAATHDGKNGKYTDDINNTNIIIIDGDDDATVTLANLMANSNVNNTAGCIGGTDGNDHSTRIEINGGIIYAGNGLFDYGTAIGGGGNGFGIVEINGGIVTAITSSTGTAIGGGCGTSGPGGYGEVTINDGEVYAYNYKPYMPKATTVTDGVVTAYTENTAWSDAIPTAIGGGSSGAQIGGLGIVEINDGYVFAYSEVGNAIGGGGGGKGNYREKTNSDYSTRYMNATGGDSEILITGGLIKAVSNGTAIGGGPGGGNAYDWHTADGNSGLPFATLDTGVVTNEKVSANGGDCKLTITGGTIYTGSIGGGTPKYESGKDVNKWGFTIGAAQVYISDGYLHGQVVMEGEGSEFEMTGGEINNTPIYDGNNYKFVKHSGGAVYVKTGNAILSGGTINHTETRNEGDGGAICVNGGTFTLDGTGEITDTTSANNGGAVHVSNGNVYINSGEIHSTSAYNGGAISVYGGSLFINGGDIRNCVSTIDGGALYVSNGDIIINDGNISYNEAGYGGAMYASGGDVTINHGIITHNEAICGGAIYISGTVDTYLKMYSGELSDNKASDDGGAIYVTSGNLIIGVKDCLGVNGENEDHTSNNLGKYHPQVHNNKAADCGGGIAIVNEGEVHFYCGHAIGNEALYKGVGKNVFMDGGEFYFYDGTNVGVPRDPDLVIIGGELYNMCTNINMIKIKYNKSNETASSDTLEGLAELEEYINLPDAEYFWDGPEGYRFVGWTPYGYDSAAESKVVRDKSDYKPSGTSIQIEDTPAMEAQQNTYDGLEDEIMHLYAVWAPSTSKITYVNGLTFEEKSLVNSGTTNTPTTYNISEVPYEITISANKADVTRKGFDIVGWYIFQDPSKNGNWSDLKNGVYEAYEPVYKRKGIVEYSNLNFSTDGSAMKYFELDTPNSDLTLTVDELTFGDIVLLPNYEVAYEDLIIDTQRLGRDTDVSLLYNLISKQYYASANKDEILREDIIAELDSLVARDVRIAANADGKIVVKHLPLGVYILDASSGWNWRYNGNTAELMLDTTNITFKSTLNQNNYKWMDFNSYLVNKLEYVSSRRRS